MKFLFLAILLINALSVFAVPTDGSDMYNSGNEGDGQNEGIEEGDNSTGETTGSAADNIDVLGNGTDTSVGTGDVFGNSTDVLGNATDIAANSTDVLGNATDIAGVGNGTASENSSESTNPAIDSNNGIAEGTGIANGSSDLPAVFKALLEALSSLLQQ